MRNHKLKETEKLIEKFFNGDTTLGEERRLYRLFEKRGLPPELERYRAVFGAFGSMQAETVSRATLMPVALRALKYAAAALILLIGTTTLHNYHEERTLARLYGGSYVIENGHRIDDLSLIYTDIKDALCTARDIENQATKADAVRQAELDVLNSIDDPKERARINEMLNE